MIDYSTEVPDLCWFIICQNLAIADIARLSSTCRKLYEMFWSRQSLLWIYLINNSKFHSSSLCQSIKTFLEQDGEENEDLIIAANDQFSQRLLSDVETYGILHEKFLKPGSFRTWFYNFTMPEKEKRGFFASKRLFSLERIPFLDDPVPLSAKLFRCYYYR